MSKDIQVRLRDHAEVCERDGADPWVVSLIRNAADEINRLRAARENHRDMVLDLDFFSAATEMRRRGGTFAKCLADAFFAADDDNSAKLVNAFAPLFKRYYEYAQQDSRAAG